AAGAGRAAAVAAWVAAAVALPTVLGAAAGGSAGRELSWLAAVGGAEVGASVLVYRVLRDWERARRDPFGLVLGRRPGLFGDRLRLAGEDRFLHLAVLGPTGSGKTQSVLLPALRQDLWHGAGVSVLDPKGDLAEGALAAAAEAGRPVALLRPGDSASVRLNPLDAPPAEAAETVVYAFDRAFPGDHPFYRPLGQNLLRFATRALVEVRPGSGLGDLLRLLEDETFRLEVLVRVRDEAVRRYFRDVFAAWPARARAEYTAGVVNALLTLVGQPDLAAIFAPPATLDLGAHLAEGGVLVADLPVGRLGAGAGLAGAFLLSTLQRLALARGEGARPHFVYVDEFAAFAPGGFGEMLAMARSKRVGAVLAHQHLGQLAPALRQAVEANARNRLVLAGVAPDDALALARLATAEGARERALAHALRHLPRGQGVLFAVRRGQVLPPARLLLPAPSAARRG
ncbi:MAG: type IV secretory system conjugative DNA transfer family protein, partial [Firmicutes bacterium]|nr:type IV secretory system conjugative DNA transfer family protein [Bacillota bacterium]